MRKLLIGAVGFGLVAILILAGCRSEGGSSAKWVGTKQLGTAGEIAEAYGVAVDARGSVYVAGPTTGGLDGNTRTGNTDAFIAKYDSIGTKLFTKQTGTIGAVTQPNGVAVDASGNVYVAGNTLAGSFDAFLLKYDSTGTKLYTKQTGTTGANTCANVVAVDASGNVYVVGNTTGGLDENTLAGSYDAFITKYDPAGTKVYTRQTGTIGSNTFGRGLAVDASGNVYMAGYTSGGLDGNIQAGSFDAFVIKYDPTATKLYTKQIGIAGADTKAFGVAVDASGNAYMAGYTSGGLDGNTLSGFLDFFVTKYDPAGNKQ